MKLKKRKKETGKSITLFLLGCIIFFSGWAFLAKGSEMDFLRTEIFISKNLGINPKDSIILNFSSNFQKSSYEGKIEIEPQIEFIETYEESKIILSPKENWPLGGKMKIVLPKARNFAFFPIKERNFNFVVADYPKISYIYPFPEMEDVIIGIEDPIEISFLSSTIGFKIDFETNPQRELLIEADEMRKNFKILPKEPFAPGSKVSFKIFATYFEGFSGKSKKIFEGNFVTLPPYPNKWSKNLSERILEAKRFTRPKITNGKYIDINLGAQVLSVFESGSLLDSFLISSGKRGMETPKGEFQVYNKFPRPWSRAYSLFMPFWMAITTSGKYGIHELPEWPGGYKEGANHLGIPVSHGCIRLGVGAAEKVYSFAEIGTKVIIY